MDGATETVRTARRTMVTAMDDGITGTTIPVAANVAEIRDYDRNRVILHCQMKPMHYQTFPHYQTILRVPFDSVVE